MREINEEWSNELDKQWESLEKIKQLKRELLQQIQSITQVRNSLLREEQDLRFRIRALESECSQLKYSVGYRKEDLADLSARETALRLGKFALNCNASTEIKRQILHAAARLDNEPHFAELMDL